MKLAVLNLTGGGASGGYRRYVSAILPKIAADPRVGSLLCAAPQALGVESWFGPSPKVRFVHCEPFRFLRHSPDRDLEAELDAFGPDLIFVPLERYISYRGVPVVTVLHNMAPLAGARTGCGIISRLKSAAQAFESRVAVRNSAAVIAPTEFVGDFLVSQLAAPRERVSVINFGPSPLPKDARRPGPFGPERPHEFIFTVGSMELYRGLEDLIEAFPAVRKNRPGIKLAVGGGARPATLPYLKSLKSLAAARGVEEAILWLDGLSQAELAWCYGNCAAFVMTSRLESFGFPALEAMQHGCQCVSSSSPCLPEMFGEASLYYEPGDQASLSAALTSVLSRTGAEKDRFRGLALARAADFSWDRAAAATLELLTSVSPAG